MFVTHGNTVHVLGRKYILGPLQTSDPKHIYAR